MKERALLNIEEVSSFMNGLRQDIEAVKNVIMIMDSQGSVNK